MLKEWFSSQKKTVRISEESDKYTSQAVEKYDAIIVGAGPSGCCSAYFMAQSGLKVLLLERGPYPGAKTCGGSSLISEHVHKLFPNFWDEMDWERLITSQAYWLMSESSSTQMKFSSQLLGAAPFNRFSVRRVNLYSWLAEKAKSAGVTLHFSHCVAEVLKEGNKSVGVRIAPPQASIYLADMIVLAEGANALLAEQGGFSAKVSPYDLALYGKETIALPPPVIEERFNLTKGQGTIIGFIGYPTSGFNGTASLHTFKASININVGMSAADFAKSGFSPRQLIDRIKKHPDIRPLLKNGIVTEYGAGVLPEGGYQAIPQLVHPGLMIVGDAASIVNGVHGFSLAMWSGYFAAQAAHQAKLHRDFSQKRLALYTTLMKESFVLQDLKANAPQAGWLRNSPYLFDLYSRIANNAAYHIVKVYTMPKREKRRFIFKKITSMQPPGKMLRDAWKFLKVVRSS